MNLLEKYILEKPDIKKIEHLKAIVIKIKNLADESKEYGKELDELNKHFTIKADLMDILLHEGDEDFENFILLHMTPSIDQFQDATDEELLWLITQIMDNQDDFMLTNFYSDIVTYNIDSTENLFDLIYYQKVKNPIHLLERLRSGSGF